MFGDGVAAEIGAEQALDFTGIIDDFEYGFGRLTVLEGETEHVAQVVGEPGDFSDALGVHSFGNRLWYFAFFGRSPTRPSLATGESKS